MRQIWGGGAGEKKRLQYFEFGLQYLVQPLGVNPTYSTFNINIFLEGFELNIKLVIFNEEKIYFKVKF